MLSSCRYHIREGEQVQRLLHHGESKEAEGVQAEHCHHRCVLLQKSCSQCLKITLTLSVGPLGDQIVRGEMAAPTGRSKDRTRMDEDEVSSSWLNLCKWCFNTKMFLVVFQYFCDLTVLCDQEDAAATWNHLYRNCSISVSHIETFVQPLIK